MIMLVVVKIFKILNRIIYYNYATIMPYKRGKIAKYMELYRVPIFYETVTPNYSLSFPVLLFDMLKRKLCLVNAVR